MRTEHYEEIFERFKQYHPYMANDAVDFRPRGDAGIRITMRDGSRYDYDMVTDSVRKSRVVDTKDILDITDEHCRSVIAYNLKEQMALKGFSQHTLSEYTGLSKGTIYNYLSESATPSATAMRKLSRALGCTIDELMS